MIACPKSPDSALLSRGKILTNACMLRFSRSLRPDSRLFKRALLVVLVIAFFNGNRGYASMEFIPPRLTSPDAARISLLTAGLGEDLAARYGHTMIRIEDPGNELDYLVNWGVFEFSDPMFIPKFFRGILIYKMGFGNYNANIRYYSNVEIRPLWERQLNLTANQKIALVDKIIWNAQPENIQYQYQYFRNNCATTPRDYLDTILKGNIKRATQDKKVGMTFRDYVRRNLAINSVVGWGLDVIFNADNDKELSAWEEMFYPPKLDEYLSQLPAYNDDGTAIPGSKLLTDRKVLVDVKEPNDNPIDGYWFVLFFVTIPLLILLISQGRPAQDWLVAQSFRYPWQWRLFGLSATFWGLTAGFFGLTHTLAWLFSAHTDLHRNLNILLFWPVDFLILFWGIRFLVFGAKASQPKTRTRLFWRRLAVGHVVLILVYLMLALSGITGQYLIRVIIHMVPASLLIYYIIATRVFVERRNSKDVRTK